MENKTGKYFKYAIGEIILVVIGILIALQINNWNSNRLDTKKTKIVLQSIKADIIKDTLEIEKFFDRAATEVKFVKNFQERVHSNKATIDTIINIAKFEFSYYWVGQPGYTNNSYESIKSSGYIENIPEYLKMELKEYYDNQDYSVKITDKMNDQYRTRLDEFTKTYSPIIADFGEARNYAYLEDVSWQDINPKHFYPRFKALIDTKHVLWSLFLDELKTRKQKSIDLLKNIDKYLND